MRRAVFRQSCEIENSRTAGQPRQESMASDTSRHSELRCANRSTPHCNP